jgi:hypothetical protein
MKYWIVLFIVSFSLSCFGQENNISESDLIGCWTHSREENKVDSKIMVYRSCDYKEFPISRYRHRFELKENGKCNWLQLASNDSHSMVEGTWKYKNKSKLLRFLIQKENL